MESIHGGQTANDGERQQPNRWSGGVVSISTHRQHSHGQGNHKASTTTKKTASKTMSSLDAGQRKRVASAK